MRSTAPDPSHSLHSPERGLGDLQEVVETFKQPLVSYLTRLSGDHATGEDLAQETFLRFFEHRNRYREEGNLKAYLYKIATNLLRSHQRKQSRRATLGRIFLLPDSPRTEAPQERGLETDELRGQLEREIRRLPLKFSIPLFLAEVEGWGHRDIARLQNCSIGTVKSRVHRAKLKLRERLQGWRPSGSPNVASPDIEKSGVRP